MMPVHRVMHALNNLKIRKECLHQQFEICKECYSNLLSEETNSYYTILHLLQLLFILNDFSCFVGTNGPTMSVLSPYRP
jgi:hypothetical protein